MDVGSKKATPKGVAFFILRLCNTFNPNPYNAV